MSLKGLNGGGWYLGCFPGNPSSKGLSLQEKTLSYYILLYQLAGFLPDLSISSPLLICFLFVLVPLPTSATSDIFLTLPDSLLFILKNSACQPLSTYCCIARLQGLESDPQGAILIAQTHLQESPNQTVQFSSHDEVYTNLCYKISPDDFWDAPSLQKNDRSFLLFSLKRSQGPSAFPPPFLSGLHFLVANGKFKRVTDYPGGFFSHIFMYPPRPHQMLQEKWREPTWSIVTCDCRPKIKKAWEQDKSKKQRLK